MTAPAGNGQWTCSPPREPTPRGQRRGPRRHAFQHVALHRNGNMIPAWASTICVDINPAVVTKLSDRGSGRTLASSPMWVVPGSLGKNSRGSTSMDQPTPPPGSSTRSRSRSSSTMAEGETISHARCRGPWLQPRAGQPGLELARSEGIRRGPPAPSVFSTRSRTSAGGSKKRAPTSSGSWPLVAKGPLALPDIAKKLGIEAKDVGSAFGGLSKDKVLVMDGEKRAASHRTGRKRWPRGKRRCSRCCPGRPRACSTNPR